MPYSAIGGGIAPVPLSFPAERSNLSPPNFATTHLIASILNCYLPMTSRPMKWRTPFRNSSFIGSETLSEKLKKAVAVSEEKIEEGSRRRG